MPTRPVESTHDKVEERQASGGESPSADEMPAGPHVGNADDLSYSDQDIDTAGTAHDDLSPTKSL